jgi:ligand-binding SRPBCC domain-containing protein
MIRIEVRARFDLPVETVFDAERDITLHARTQRHRGERPVDGVTSGLIQAGQEVEWEARHFGIRQRLRVRIEAMDRPRSFRDVMVRGAFKALRHEHIFRALDRGRCEKLDVLEIEAPLGPLGWIAERLFLGAYMRRFLMRKNADLQTILEWRAG